MPAVRRSPLLVAFWRFHRFLYRVSGGRIGNRLGPGQQLLLTTTGRRSGTPRDVTLTYLDHGGTWSWSELMQAKTPILRGGSTFSPIPGPKLVGRMRKRVRAVEVAEPERTRLYGRFVDEIDRAYAEYIDRTSRRIPVVALTPVD